MNHNSVYAEFRNRFPQMAEGEDAVWFSNGKDSIRIQYGRRNYIFTFHSNDSWMLETATHFINRTRGRL